jgi:hypothetical protein
LRLCNILALFLRDKIILVRLNLKIQAQTSMIIVVLKLLALCKIVIRKRARPDLENQERVSFIDYQNKIHRPLKRRRILKVVLIFK